MTGVFGMRGTCRECGRRLGVISGADGWVVVRHFNPKTGANCSGSFRPAQDVR